jgi:hypothetical protein
MGGMAAAFKHRPVASRLVADMHVYGNSTYSSYDMDNSRTMKKPSAPVARWKWMKMAFGENPKRNYGHWNRRTPTTRMGHAWLVRQEFQRAHELQRKQEEWCQAHAPGMEENESHYHESFPVDLSLQTLVEVLRGEVKLNVHVYTVSTPFTLESLIIDMRQCLQTHDIETLFRLSDEFQFPIAAIHHATSAHLVAKRIAEERQRPGSRNKHLVAALFADKGYYKAEVREINFFQSKLYVVCVCVYICSGLSCFETGAVHSCR